MIAWVLINKVQQFKEPWTPNPDLHQHSYELWSRGNDDKMGARVSWTELYVVSMDVIRLGQALGRMGDYYMKLNCTA